MGCFSIIYDPNLDLLRSISLKGFLLPSALSEFTFSIAPSADGLKTADGAVATLNNSELQIKLLHYVCPKIIRIFDKRRGECLF